ncbi:MAG: PEGA domain-containing protein [Myxococcota bacterium]
MGPRLAIRLASFAVAACLWLAGAAASAQDGEDRAREPENPEAARLAREHFRQGMAHFEEHAYRDAIQEFHLAAKRVPSADLWFNIGRAHEELSEYEAAVDYYRRYLRDRVDPPDEERMRRHIEALEARIEQQREAARRRPTTGTLRIRSEEDGARIELDGRRIGEAPLAVPVTLPPGRHRVDFEKEGHIPFRSEVTLDAGVTTGAYADMDSKTEYRSVRGKRVWTWVVGGLAVAALGASVGLGSRALRLNNDGQHDRARDWATYADYSLGSALGLGVVATILYFVEGRSRGTERVEPAGP